MIKKLCLLLLCCTFMVGCGPTNKVIAPLKYKDEIGVQSSKNAYIYWMPGRCVAGQIPEQSHSSNEGGGLAGLVVMAIATTIDNQNRKNNPSQYAHEYSKADEAVFITSLRDTLLEQNVFKNTEIVTNLNEISSKNILIKIHFETARASKFGDVTLTTKLTISGGGKSKFKRTYFVQNDDPKARTFIEKKTDASHKLLTEIAKGIKRWHKEEKL